MSRGRRSRDRGYISGNRTIAADIVHAEVNYLVVAGGGAGGKDSSGGGGAGGLRSTVTGTGGSGSLESALTLFTGTSYTVTVGAGAATTSGAIGSGTNGSNSVFSTITSMGGGAGGGWNGSIVTNGATGGSGGGGAAGGAGTVNQGFAGGNVNGGGGGGASAVGAASTVNLGGSGSGGAGGAGRTVAITGSNVTYGGGGGGAGDARGTNPGGAGGSGGGGAGGQTTAGTAGTANTGGGGGGGPFTNPGAANGGAGGSGVVILRYSNLYTLSIGAGLSYSTQTVDDDKVTTFTGGSGSISLSPAPVTTGDYESIATVLVGSAGASSFTFSNIPQTYKHLQLRIIARTTFNSYDDYLSMRFNGDSGANYTYHGIYAQNAIPPAAYGGGNQTILSLQRVAGATAPANTFGIVIADILDYTSANKFKTFKNLGGCENNTQGSVYLHSGVWQNTAAITSVQIFGGNASSTLVQYSHFALYGIRG